MLIVQIGRGVAVRKPLVGADLRGHALNPTACRAGRVSADPLTMELLHPGRIRRAERRAARLAIRDSTSIYRDGERLVVANADAQWFHELGVKPWLAGGPRDPLSADLIAGYDVEVASTQRGGGTPRHWRPPKAKRRSATSRFRC
jgi:hypothetical protein